MRLGVHCTEFTSAGSVVSLEELMMNGAAKGTQSAMTVTIAARIHVERSAARWRSS
ncbi:hypothetical protein [Streptomyces sp. 1222.5]|uniref:hypothetical protein n=1 Tax=Streptomyces sp. 1222.5 TaxID=1881026 RepID=UPI003D731129